MATLRWGKPTIEVIKLVDGEVPSSGTWIKLENPKQDTTELTSTEGEKKEAIIEGGEVIATKRGKNKPTFTTTLYVKDDAEKPIEDDDGVIDGEYAVRVYPASGTLKGKLMEKTSVSVIETYTPEEGDLLQYTFDVLKPKTGKMVKVYDPAG